MAKAISNEDRILLICGSTNPKVVKSVLPMVSVSNGSPRATFRGPAHLASPLIPAEHSSARSRRHRRRVRRDDRPGGAARAHSVIAGRLLGARPGVPFAAESAILRPRLAEAARACETRAAHCDRPGISLWNVLRPAK